MSDFEQLSDQPKPSLLSASNVGDFVLHGEKVYTPHYLQEEASRIPDTHQRDLRLGEIATASHVIVWRVRSTLDLPDEQKSRLEKISRSVTKEVRAKQFSVSPRTEARRTADLLDHLRAPTLATAVIAGICADLLQINRTKPPQHAWLTNEELGWCRSIGLGNLYTTIAPSLGTVPQRFAVWFKKVYEKVPAPEHANLMRRLFEVGIYQPYRPGQIFGDSEITKD